MSRTTNPPHPTAGALGRDPFAALSHKRPRVIATTVTARRPLTALTETGRTLRLVQPEADARPAPRTVVTPAPPSAPPAKRSSRAQRARKEELIAEARRRIAQENRASAELPIDDARRIVATRIARALEGGRAAILTPDVRRDIVTEAKRLGLRPFDANLIIAIVQDRARCAEPSDQLAADGRIRLVRGAGEKRAGLTGTGNSEASSVGSASEMVSACIAFGTAVAMVTLLITWTLGVWPA